MANVKLGARLFKGRERRNVERALYYLRLVREQEIRDNTAMIGGFTNTPGICINTGTNSLLAQCDAIQNRLAKALTWICKGHGKPTPDENGDLP